MSDQGPWHKGAVAAALTHVMVWTVLWRAGVDAAGAVGWGVVSSICAFVLVGAASKLRDDRRHRQLEAVPPE